MPFVRKLAAAGLLVATIGIGFHAGCAAAQTGPISAADAKAAKAKSVAQKDCLETCKSRGKVKPPSACANWCAPGQCYRSTSEAYCVK